MKRCTPLIAIAALLLTAPGLQASDTYATNFNGLAPGSDPPNLGPVDFLPPGEVQFFANGPYYVPGSNRAWGFAGQGQVNLPFGDWSSGVASLLADPTNHAAEVTLELRGSRSTDQNNRTGVPFDDAQVGLVWYDEDNVRWVGGVTVEGAAGVLEQIDNGAGVQQYVSIDNDSYQTISIDPTAVGADAVSRVRLVQGTDAAYAYALVGSLAFTTVPEPSSLMAFLLACLGAPLRARVR